MPAVNALLLGSLMYRSRLVPHVIQAVGLVGAPLQLAAFAATFSGLIDRVPGWSAVAAMPVAAWELSIGVWTAVKGVQAGSGRAGNRLVSFGAWC